MTKIARAAEIWARLEKRLIEQCGLPNGHMLEVNRPYLIRWIGNRLKATPLETERRAAAVKNVSPPLPVKEVEYVEQPAVARPAHRHRNVSVQARLLPVTGDTINDAKLAAMLERACSRRTGYDGDDTVSYERG
jgi:hypothetical protein